MVLDFVYRKFVLFFFTYERSFVFTTWRLLSWPVRCGQTDDRGKGMERAEGPVAGDAGARGRAHNGRGLR